MSPRVEPRVHARVKTRDFIKSKMEAVSRVIKIQLPNYLRSLPIPSTFSGFLKLSGSEWVQLVPFVVTTSVVVYLVVSALVPSKPKKEEEWVNKTKQKEKEKVADAFQIEDLGDTTACCRCWKSKKVCALTSLFLSVAKWPGGVGYSPKM